MFFLVTIYYLIGCRCDQHRLQLQFKSKCVCCWTLDFIWIEIACQILDFVHWFIKAIMCFFYLSFFKYEFVVWNSISILAPLTGSFWIYNYCENSVGYIINLWINQVVCNWEDFCIIIIMNRKGKFQWIFYFNGTNLYRSKYGNNRWPRHQYLFTIRMLKFISLTVQY